MCDCRGGKMVIEGVGEAKSQKGQEQSSSEEVSKWLMQNAQRVDTEELSRHERIILSQNMILDNVEVTIEQSEIGNLINIPVEVPEGSGILRERFDHGQRYNRSDMQESGKGDRRKWRRCKGKENARPIKLGIEEVGMLSVNRKRQWSLRDEDENAEEINRTAKRLKELQDFQEEDMIEVGVANLKWPQMDQ